jgi:hypothetical protein
MYLNRNILFLYLKYMIKLILVVLLFFVIIYFVILKNNNKEKEKQNYDLNELVIIDRTPEQEKLVNKLLEEKKMAYTNEEINSLKNKTQFYNVLNNKIVNISEQIINNEKNNKNKNTNNNNNINLNTKLNINDITNNTQIDKQNKISNLTSFNNEKSLLIDDCNDITKNETTCSNKLNNYYHDIYGNTIKSSMNDYITAYNTTIDETNPKYCIPVKTLNGNSDFIIPNQYNFEKYWTSAYNTDFSRVINPMTIY